MGEDRFEVIAAKAGFVGEDFGVGIVLVSSSAITNDVGGVAEVPLTEEFILYGLPSAGLGIPGGSIEISISNGELGPSSQVISSSSAV